MTIFESINNTTDKAGETAEKYVKTSKEYLRLKVFQQLTIMVSWIVKSAIIGGCIALAVIFLAVAGAIALGEAVGNMPLGYVLIALIFIILTIVVYNLKRKIDKKIIQTISAKFFD